MTRQEYNFALKITENKYYHLYIYKNTKYKVIIFGIKNIERPKFSETNKQALQGPIQ